MQLVKHDELLWDNGTPFIEPCIDRLAPHIGKVRLVNMNLGLGYKGISWFDGVLICCSMRLWLGCVEG